MSVDYSRSWQIRSNNGSYSEHMEEDDQQEGPSLIFHLLKLDSMFAIKKIIWITDSTYGKKYEYMKESVSEYME